VMEGSSKRAMLEGIRLDINTFKDINKCDRLVMIWCASTEIYIEIGPTHVDLESFERAIDADDPTIAPSMLYAYAALLEGVPFANGAPNLSVDVPALRQYAQEHNVPISGKDFKTGQTLLKTVLAPMLKARMLGLAGWYSTNSTSSSLPSTPSSTATSSTRCASTTTRRVVTTKRVGTTSICSVGSATRCS
jgi:myo-inositol-1-phosphate synthase